MSLRSRHLLSVAIFIILKRGNDICLLRRARTGWLDGCMSLPAGRLDAQETLLQAVIREAREEVGIILKPDALRHAHTLHSLTSGSDWLGHFFVADEWIGEPAICEPDKHDALQWASISDLPENIIPYVGQALLNIEEGRHYSEFGWVGSKAPPAK